MSQNKSTTKLCIRRVAIGKNPIILWDRFLDKTQLKELSVTFNEKKILKTSDPTKWVNKYRFEGIDENSEWIWLIDADVMPTQETIMKALKLISPLNHKTHPVIGGFYLNAPHSGFLEKCYNRLCNLWSRSNQIPLAGNIIIHKNFFSNLKPLEGCHFGQEEWVIKGALKNLGLQVFFSDEISLPHYNKKNIKFFFQTAMSQGRVRAHSKRSLSKYSYQLLKDFLTHPIESIFVTLYLFTSLGSGYWASLTHLITLERSSSYRKP